VFARAGNRNTRFGEINNGMFRAYPEFEAILTKGPRVNKRLAELIGR
jgi:hypothetical protein